MLSIVLRSAVLPMFIIVIIAVACGSDDQGPTFVTGGPIDCSALRESSYTYHLGVVFDRQDSGAGLPGPAPFRLEQTFDGEVDDADSISVTGLTRDGVNPTNTSITIDDGRAWRFSNVTGWEEVEVGNDGGLSLIPYLPFDVCEALVPDIDTTVEGSAEVVNGIRSERLDLGILTSDFFDRIPSIGPGSDAATLFSELDISVWVAHDGSYTSKVTATGSGIYPDGYILTVTLEFEVTEQDADVNVVPPL